jgi:hypothetical protein
MKVGNCLAIPEIPPSLPLIKGGGCSPFEKGGLKGDFRGFMAILELYFSDG